MPHSQILDRLRACAGSAKHDPLSPTQRVKAIRQLLDDLASSVDGLRLTVRSARAIRKAIDELYSSSVERESFWTEVRALTERVESLDPRKKEYERVRKKKEAKRVAEEEMKKATIPTRGLQELVELKIVPEPPSVYTPVYIDPWDAPVSSKELIDELLRLLKVQQTIRNSNAHISNEMLIEAALNGRPRTKENLQKLHRVLKEGGIPGILVSLVEVYLCI